MELNVSGLPYQDFQMNSAGVGPAQRLGPSASPTTTAPQIIAALSQSQDVREISSPPDEIDISHIRKDLCFPVTMDKSKFTEIMHPKSEEDLEKYMPWMCLVRDIFQPRPKIVEDTHEELKQINLSSEKDFDPIREQRYWQNQIFLRYAVEEGLSKGHHELDLKSWLEDLHKIACSGLDGFNHYYDENNGKFSSPSQGVMTRYQEKPPEELKGYLEKFEQFLDLRNSSKNNVQDWLVDVAEKYGDVSIGPPFERVNNSIVMNILNLMLKKHGMSEISHGNLDQGFYDYRRDKEELQKVKAEFPHSIFLRAILQTNPTLKKELGPFLNTPDEFAEYYKRYLNQLSELDKSGILSPETYHLMKYLPADDLLGTSMLLEKIIKFKDVVEKGLHKGVFTDELFKNCLDDISEAFDNLNLSKVSLFVKQEGLLLKSLGLKLSYPNFDTSVPTLKDLSSNLDRELAGQNIGDYGRAMLRMEGLNFLNITDDT